MFKRLLCWHALFWLVEKGRGQFTEMFYDSRIMNQEVTMKRLEWVQVLRQSCSSVKGEAGTGTMGHWQIFGTETGKPVPGLRWWGSLLADPWAVSWQTPGQPAET